MVLLCPTTAFSAIFNLMEITQTVNQNYVPKSQAKQKYTKVTENSITLRHKGSPNDSNKFVGDKSGKMVENQLENWSVYSVANTIMKN